MRAEGTQDECSRRDRLRGLIHSARRQAGVAARGGSSASAGCLDAAIDSSHQWSADSAVRVLETHLSGYEFLREIHRGGQGIVYEALQRSTQRRVAIKVLGAGPFAGQSEMQRFLREARVLARLSHPNIVAIHDSGHAAGYFYLVMDFVDGQPVDRWAAGLGGGSVRSILGVFAEICEAVSAAHLLGIIHRDLKPANVMIDGAGRPRVLDFGLAKLADGSGDGGEMTGTGQFVGTLPWVSPEQSEGSQHLVDVRSDVYSLGVMIYQLLTRRFPYEVGGPVRAVMENIATVEPARPSGVAQGLDDEIDTIVLKCLSKDPGRRYQSGGELAGDVRRYLAGEPIAARRDSLGYLLRKGLRRHRGAVAVGVAFVVVVLVGLAASLRGWREATQALQRARAAEQQEIDQRKRAETEAADAAAVNGLLRRVLTAASPYASPDTDVTARELLEAAAKELDAGGTTNPEVEARVRMTLADAFFGIGRYDACRNQLDAAETLWTRIRGKDSLDEADALAMRAAVELTDRSSEAAERAGGEAVRICRERGAVESLIGAAALMSYGKALNYNGKREGIASMREALSLYRRLMPEADRRLTSAMVDVALALGHEEGSRQEAEGLLREAMEINRRVNGGLHVDMFTNLVTLADMLFMQRDAERAEPVYREAEAIGRQVLGAAHPSVVNCRSNLASLYSEMQRFDDAEAIRRDLIVIERETHKNGSPALVMLIRNLGDVRRMKGDMAGAEQSYREAVAEAERSGTSDTLLAYMARDDLAERLVERGAVEEAESLLRRQLGHPPSDSPMAKREMALARSLMGRLEAEQGQYRAAEVTLTGALDDLSASPMGGPIAKRVIVERIVMLYEKWDAAEPGKGYAAKAVEWQEKLPPKREFRGHR